MIRFRNTEFDLDYVAEISADGSYDMPVLAGYAYRVFLFVKERGGYAGRPIVELTQAPVQVTSDRTLDFEVAEPVELSGVLRVRAGELVGSERLEVVKIHEQGPKILWLPLYYSNSSVVSVPIDTLSNPNFSLMVHPGTYRVRFLSDADSGLRSQTLVESLEVRGDTFETIDVVSLRGRIEVPERLQLASPPTLSRRHELELDADGGFERLMTHGTYTLSFTLEATDGGDYGYRERFEYEVEVDGDTEIVLRPEPDIVEMTGVLDGLDELNAAHPPRLGFVPLEAEGRPRTIEVLPEGGEFSVILPRGLYRMYLNYGERSWERYKRIRLGEVVAEESRHLQIEAPSFDTRIELNGVVTLRGEVPPETSDSSSEVSEGLLRGSLHFICIDGAPCHDLTITALAVRGPASYKVELWPDATYRVELRVEVKPGGRVVAAKHLSPLPLGTYVLQPELVVERSHRRDFDFKTIRLKTKVTAHGHQLPAADENQAWGGGRRAVRPGSSLEHEDLPLSGPVSYEADFFPGYSSHSLQLSIPNESSRWREHCLPVTEGVTQEISLPLHKAQVQLTHNGEAIDAADSLGTLSYTTAWGTPWKRVESDGNAEVWWFGANPSVILRRYFDSSSEDPLPDGFIPLSLDD